MAKNDSIICKHPSCNDHPQGQYISTGFCGKHQGYGGGPSLTVTDIKDNSNLTVGDALFLNSTTLKDNKGVEYLPVNQLSRWSIDEKTKEVDWSWHFENMHNGNNFTEISEDDLLELYDEEQSNARGRFLKQRENPHQDFIEEEGLEDEYKKWLEENEIEDDFYHQHEFLEENYDTQYENWEIEEINYIMEPIESTKEIYGFVTAIKNESNGEVQLGYNTEYAEFENEDGTYEEIYSSAPAMNFVYPLNVNLDVEEAAKLLSDTNLVLVTDTDNSEIKGMSLTGGGMDLNWSIAEAYVRLGQLPPPKVVSSLPNFAGMKLTPINKRVLEASREAALIENPAQANSINDYFDRTEANLRENGISNEMFLGD